MKSSLKAGLSIVMLAMSLPAAAGLAGTRTVTLHGQGGEKRVIGTVTFTADGDGWRFAFKRDPAAFEERFLAMRPFGCLDGDAVSLCHFPYAAPQRITASDLTDLEYQLMFLQKPRASVSLDPENGVYYQLRLIGDRIEGTLREVDMDPIVAPDGYQARPIRAADLYTVDLSGKWLPRLTIE